MANIEEVKQEQTEEVVTKENVSKKPFNKKGDRRERPVRREESEFDKRVVSVRRVTKVVKGGRTQIGRAHV